MAFASIRATEVLPVPLGPVKRIAWATRLDLTALVKVWVTWFCFITSSKVWGR